jgi:hydroxymethylpyrimidine pyrophosphatase-like HAD family hydrolase
MAFGDAANDLPMLSFARYGFAMENASAACREGAPYLTKSNAEDGVALAVCKVMDLTV